jgi:hypothetical protein
MNTNQKAIALAAQAIKAATRAIELLAWTLTVEQARRDFETLLATRQAAKLTKKEKKFPYQK